MLQAALEKALSDLQKLGQIWVVASLVHELTIEADMQSEFRLHDNHFSVANYQHL